jgi:nucleotide-binding universal stress UspA family protein
MNDGASPTWPQGTGGALVDMKLMGHTIMVGYDGSEPAQRALKRAAEFAGEGESVIVVTAAEGLFSDARTGEIVDPGEVEERDRLLVEGRSLLAEQGIAASTLPKDGEPGDALVGAATDEGADLLVVGTRGRNRLARTLLGSVSTKVVQDAPCDVLVVR